jgi:hypothetical protein
LLAPSRRYRWPGAFASVWVAVGWASGCASQMYCEYPTGPCTQAGGPTEAAVTAVAAGALWAGGGGCKIAGCRHPLVCNQGSELCEYLPCGENKSVCPAGTRCEPTSQTCR